MNNIKELEQLLKKEKLLRIEAERKLDVVKNLLWELIEDKVVDKIELYLD